jgi:hypothetical protein
VEVPKPSWYRRFGVVVLAANLVGAAVLVAAVVALWPRAAQRPGAPATTAGLGPQAEQVVPQGPEPAAVLPTSTRAHPEPGVLWQQGGSAGSVGGRFAAPGRWRVLWSFNCRSFARYGGGNFKLYGAGAFAGVSVQRVGVRGRGVLRVSGGGRGRLIIEAGSGKVARVASQAGKTTGWRDRSEPVTSSVSGKDQPKRTAGTEHFFR